MRPGWKWIFVMAFGFHATWVHANDNPPRLSFLDRDDDTSEHYFVMDRSEDTPDEALPDMDNVYVERDDQQWGGFGGIERVLLDRGGLSIRLGARMAEQMGQHDEICITFDIEEGEFNQLRYVLQLIMRGYEERLESRVPNRKS
jgi:hypothetical protein